MMLDRTSLKISKDNLHQKAFIIILFLYIYVPTFTVVLPLRVADIGVYSILYIIVFIFFIIYSSHGILKKRVINLTLLMIVAFTIVNILRMSHYGDSAAIFFSNRAPLMFLLYWIFCLEGFKSRNVNFLNSIKWVIIINAIIQALAGIIHQFIFPDVIIGQQGLTDLNLLESHMDAVERNRETGLLFGGMYPNILLLGLIVVSYDLYLGRTKQIFIAYCLIILFFLGILLCKSRYPLGISLLFIAIAFFKNISFKKFVLILITAIIAIFIGYSLYMTYFYRGYFAEDRMLKIAIAMSILKQNSLFVIIGAPSQIISSTMAPNVSMIGKVYFSDNSYFSIVLNLGLPFLFLWSYILYKKFNFVIFNKFSSLFLLYVLGCLFITNSYYWEQWILYSMVLFFYFTYLEEYLKNEGLNVIQL